MSKNKLLLPDHITKQLIEEVKIRKCLWDTRIESHNDRLQVALAWKYIAEKLGVPEKLLKIKWKNIRDFYAREIKKGKTGDNYTGKWRWFKSMTFLRIAQNFIRTEAEPQDAGVVEEHSFSMNPHEPFPYIKLETPNTAEMNCDKYQDSMTCQEMILSTEDFDVMFLKSLAPYFKMLDPVRKLVVRGKMQNMLLHEIAAQNSSCNLSSS